MPQLSLATTTVDNHKFVASEWIGRGKTYPSADTPDFILAARREVLSIPEKHASLLPATSLSVLDLLALKLQAQPSNYVTPEAERAFSFEDPNDDLPALSKRRIPPDAFLRKLHKAFGPAWFNGAQSIVDTGFKQSRVPPYALTYWSEMSIILVKKATWQRAEGWLTRWEREPGFLEEADHARILMGSLAWDAQIQALGSDTSAENLAGLLSEDWLDDEHINMLLQEVYSRARLDPTLSRKVAVLPLVLQQVISNARMRSNWTHPLLDRCSRYITSGRKHLYFPVNVGGVHWVPCVIDFEAQVVRYGDSLLSTRENTSMETIIQDLQAWLLHAFQKTFTNKGNTLAHGRQDDTHSCGVCTVNAIAPVVATIII
ncbi:hypothetical protein TRAPUB_1281 [Trametes pubescens]|uniref:Ubiquitin-like protease family profile domain-containing protein n=1 Tax=Trametes pubescens TaxID=154538 RepID=A0A1M2VJL6_TRAPU|nr:hypothetical protein TRAPUB_1281 [Trametes pubescens]